MNIWRFVYRSVVWWHLMIGRHWVRCQSWPQCGYSFFWITPVSPAARGALLFCLHSWFALKQSRLNSLFNCPSKTWTYDPCFILDSGTVVAGSNQAWSCSASTICPDLYHTWQKGILYLQCMIGIQFISMHTAIEFCCCQNIKKSLKQKIHSFYINTKKCVSCLLRSP